MKTSNTHNNSKFCFPLNEMKMLKKTSSFNKNSCGFGKVNCNPFANPKCHRKNNKILMRDNFTCKLCQDRKPPLQAHCKNNFNALLPWQYNDESYITLCTHCLKVVRTFSRNHDPIISVKLYDKIKKHFVISTVFDIEDIGLAIVDCTFADDGEFKVIRAVKPEYLIKYKKLFVAATSLKLKRK